MFRKLTLTTLLLLSLVLVAVVGAQDATEEAMMEEEAPTVSLMENEGFEQPILVDSAGMTLYIFTNDEPNTVNCTGDCLGTWPLLTVESADALTVAPNVPGEVSTVEVDGAMVVTYDEMPLYYFAGDTAPGAANGQGIGDVWFVIEAAPATVGVGGNEDLGHFLVAGSNGMTLYTFANDEPGVSNCTEGCLDNWPPLTVESADDLVAAAGVPGELGTIDVDGTLYVTLDGMPLYFFAGDTAVGEANGEGRGDVWYVVPVEMMDDEMMEEDMMATEEAAATEEASS